MELSSIHTKWCSILAAPIMSYIAKFTSKGFLTSIILIGGAFGIRALPQPWITLSLSHTFRSRGGLEILHFLRFSLYFIQLITLLHLVFHRPIELAPNWQAIIIYD
jgi:hypothetical protein